MLVHSRSDSKATMIPFSADRLSPKALSLWCHGSMILSAWAKVASMYWPASLPPTVTVCPAMSRQLQSLPVCARKVDQDVESCHSNERGLSTENTARRRRQIHRPSATNRTISPWRTGPVIYFFPPAPPAPVFPCDPAFCPAPELVL